MSSVCGGLDYKDAASASSANKCSNNGSNHVSVAGSEDAQDSDGDDSGGYIHQYLNEQSEVITKPVIQEPLPLNSSDDEGEDKNLAKVIFSESPQVSAATVIIPAIKGSREKHGKSLEKLRVSWAEDVYDPPPSIVSHTRSKKQHHQKSKSRDSLKKNGKKGHKGSSSSSSSRGSKDKKSSSSSSSSSRSKHSRDKFGWATQMPIVAASS